MRQGRTDAWIAHQLDVSVKDISAFKREHELEPGEAASGEADLFGPRIEEDEPDLRAEDEALVAAALEAEQDDEPEEPRGRGRRGRWRRRGAPTRAAAMARPSPAGAGADAAEAAAAAAGRKPLDGTFDHGEDGYGLWLDPAVQDDPVYAEHWAGHRPVTVAIENDRIVITRAGEDAGSDDDDD